MQVKNILLRSFLSGIKMLLVSGIVIGLYAGGGISAFAACSCKSFWLILLSVWLFISAIFSTMLLGALALDGSKDEETYDENKD